MINHDLLTDFLLKLNALSAKKGNSFALRGEVRSAINSFFGDESLKGILINDVDNVLIPDVFVMPLYNPDFALNYLLDPYLGNNCPFGYTIEIKTSAFDTYKAEELGAIIIHHILQNAMSGCAKSRFLSAYTATMEKYSDNIAMDMKLNPASISEVCYLGYMDICLRPFNVPITNQDLIGTDEVLISIGLADAFDSALGKMRAVDHRGIETPEDYIDHEVKKDHKTIQTIFSECRNGEIPHYYQVLKDGLPLLTLRQLQKDDCHNTILGFACYDVGYTNRRFKCDEEKATTVCESVLWPKNEIELRFQLDKIITEMRYMENEAERSAVLYKLKCLQLKLVKTKGKLEKKLERHPGDKNLSGKIDYVNRMISEIDSYREETVKKAVTPKHYGVFVQYPAGYEY